jgi:hypothetical protein
MSSQFAEAIGVNPRQPFAFDLRKPCFERLYDTLTNGIADGKLVSDGNGRGRTTYEAVLQASIAVGTANPKFSPVYAASIGLSRSISTARLCPVASMRIQAYKPYRLCCLLERIAAECENLATATVDDWLRTHAAEL